MALQIGDITRQRVEHIVHALELVTCGLTADETSASAEEAWSADLAIDQVQAVAAHVLRLQSAQTAHAATDFDGEIARIAASLRELAEEASLLVRLGGDLYGADDARNGSFLDILESKLRAAERLIADCQAARSEVDEAMAAATTTLRALLLEVNSVHDIEIEMRLVGLNTNIKCGRLGKEGKPLSVIAHELRACAHKLLEDGSGLMAVLQQIVEDADRFECERRNQSVERIAALQEEMNGSLSAFRESGMRLSDALRALSRDGEQVSGLLRDTVSQLSTQEDVGRALHAAHNRLAALAGSIAISPENGRIVEERMRFFTQERYTMASERLIHEAVVASAGASGSAGLQNAKCATMDAPTCSGEKAAEALLDDFLF
jgi:hypothetical protein